MSTPPATKPDSIIITDLTLHLPYGLGPSAFSLSPAPPCPLILTLRIDLEPHVIPQSVEEDTMEGLRGGVNYSAVSKGVYAALSAAAGPGVPAGAEEGHGALPLKGPRDIAEVVLGVLRSTGGPGVKGVHMIMRLERAVLQAAAIEYSTYLPIRPSSADAPASQSSIAGTGSQPGQSGVEELEWECAIRDLRVHTIIGLHPHERQKRQGLVLDLRVRALGLVASERWSHVALTDEVYNYLEASSSGTLEALAESLAGHLFASSPHVSAEATLELQIRKPSALPFAVPSVRITRSRQSFASLPALRNLTSATSHSAVSSTSRGTLLHTAAADHPGSLVREDGSPRIFIALGGNIGDRVGNITRAVTLLEEAGVEVVDESRLYESEPMYVEDQAKFTNGAIEVKTDLKPLVLLQLLKNIEVEVGRTKTFRNGPRVVDLDLLVYGPHSLLIGEIGQEGWLELPHPRIEEREFVLRPLLDMDPSLSHPASGSFAATLANLLQGTKSGLAPIIPFPAPAQPLRLDRTKVMQIFNATPDSFSDGSADALVLPSALERIKGMWAVPHPPAILDIGGMSTAPNAPSISEEEEIGRVVPLIRAIRASEDETLAAVPISIDSFRPAVVRAAVEAGASMINDVYTAREPGMAETMASLGVPVVLMHSRGDSRSMLLPESQVYDEQGGVISGVRRELGAAVRLLREKGVRRWNITLDPGLGFAKNHRDSLTLLQQFRQLRLPGSSASSSSGPSDGQGPSTSTGTIPTSESEKVHLQDLRGYPWLIGGSRKRFVGRTIGRPEPSERGYGDAAVTAWAAKEGAELVRVHQGREMGEVLRMWGAMSGDGTEEEVQGGQEGSRG